MKNLKLLLLIGVVLLVACKQKTKKEKQSDSKPNILWITSEDNSADWLSCYGHPYAETPNIDQLAEEGFQYMNCYANAPVCAPQRSTWITGVNAVSMGTHNMRSFYSIPKEIEYYTKSLRENGYYLGNFKKRDYNIHRDSEAPWNSIEEPNWDTLKNSQPFFQIINLGSSHESSAFGDVYNTDHDPAKTKLRAFHPDVPGMRENYAHYHDAIKKMDSEVGMKVKKLEEMGLAENTIVIYVSDHGGVLPRSKRFLFKESLHCPMILRIPEPYQDLWPAETTGSKIDRLVSFVDMPKTWLSITGSQVPDYMQGKVFLGSDTEKEQQYHFAFRGRMDERIDNARAVSDKQYLYIRNYMPHLPWMQHLEYLWKMPATQAWTKAVKDGTANEMQASFFSPRNQSEELYDMEKDPDCVNNLINQAEQKKVADRMRKALRQKQIEFVDAGLLPEKEMDRYASDNNTTMYELARNRELYDVEAILNVVDLAMAKDKAKLPALHKVLDEPNVALRYWGMLGCFLLNDKEAGLKMIADDAHEIRALAAWTLINTDEKEKGIQCIEEMIEKDSYALLTLLNMAEWMGEDGKTLLPAISQMDVSKKSKSMTKYLNRMRGHLKKVL